MYALLHDLRLEGATNDESGVYPVAPVDADTPFIALCEPSEHLAGLAQIYTLGMAARLYDAASGALVQETITPQRNVSGTATFAFSFAGVPLGSYQLCAHITGAVQAPITAAQYQELTGIRLAPIYKYTEDGSVYFWDYDRNLGRHPSDLGHPFYAQRSAVVAGNLQLDRPEWATYAVSGSPQDGEWSFLRVQVGGGTWAAGDVFPNPGPALRIRQDATTWPGVPFDTMARCISASAVLKWGNGEDLDPGDCLIAGTLSNQSGPVAALWKFHEDGTADLLAWNSDPSDFKCQCLKGNHGPNGILELRDGTILLLSECSLMIYDPFGERRSDRLPGYPFKTQGHPGGYSARSADGKRPSWFTENFNPSPPGEINFYNRWRSLVAGQTEIGPGTHWHGRECSAALWGSLWGFPQDGSDDTPGVQQWLARLVEGRWDRSTFSSFPASLYRWRQVAACAGVLVCAGDRPISGVAGGLEAGTPVTPCWGIHDGRMFKEYDAPWFLLYMTRCTDDNGDEVLLCVARAVVDGVLTAEEHLIQLGGFQNGDNPGGDWIPGPLPEPDGHCEHAQCVLDTMPEGSHFLIIIPNLNGAVWEAVQPGDVGDFVNEDRNLRALEELAQEFDILWCRSDSTAPQDDLTTYRQRLTFGELCSLRHAAYENLEVVLLYTAAVGPIRATPIDKR